MEVRVGFDRRINVIFCRRARVAELADAADSKSAFAAWGIQFIAYPAAFHASTPPFSTLTFLKPCDWYFAA
jgi:hypothetical protein